MRVRKWLLVVATICATAPIHAQRPAPPCVDQDINPGGCGQEEERRLLDLYGLKPISAHRESGDEVRRAFYKDGFDQDVFAISFVRAKGREPQVSVAFPRRPGDAPWTMEAPVSATTWNDVLARSHFFDRALVPLPDNGSRFVCIDPPAALVESSDVAGDRFDTGVRRQYGSSCPGDLAFSYAGQLVNTAEPLFGFCQSLDARMSHWSILQECGKLRGDRLAAAEVMTLVDKFTSTLSLMDADLIPTTPDVLNFHSEATVEWAGQHSQPGQAGEFWLEHAGPGQHVDIAVDLVTGQSQREARVTGRLTHGSKSAANQFEVAPIEMRWTRDNLVGDFRIERVVVGAFTPEPGG